MLTTLKNPTIQATATLTTLIYFKQLECLSVCLSVQKNFGEQRLAKIGPKDQSKASNYKNTENTSIAKNNFNTYNVKNLGATSKINKIDNIKNIKPHKKGQLP